MYFRTARGVRQEPPEEKYNFMLVHVDCRAILIGGNMVSFT